MEVEPQARADIASGEASTSGKDGTDGNDEVGNYN